MDGRVQAVVAKYGQERYGVLYPDTITEAGLVGLLANNPSSEFLEGLKKKVLISIEKHHSKGIVIHGHQQCAGNPVEDDIHKQNILVAARIIGEIAPNLEIKPVFVVRENNIWTIEEL